MKTNSFLVYWWNKDVLGDGYGWEATTFMGDNERWLRMAGRTPQEAKDNLVRCLPKHEEFAGHVPVWDESTRDAFKYGTMENV